jgi:hypothetical protein
MQASGSKVTELLAHLEELWRLEDQLFDSFSAEDWQRKHGKDWVFADVPYHLAYFDRTVAEGLEAGDAVPAEKQKVLHTMGELNGWNAAKFAERPPGQTVEESRKQLGAARDAVRAATVKMTDTDLETRAWFPLPGIGWSTKRYLLMGSRSHNFSEYTQLVIRAKRPAPRPSGAVIHGAIAFYMQFFPAFMNREQAAGKRFTAVMAFTGDSGGGLDVPCE